MEVISQQHSTSEVAAWLPQIDINTSLDDVLTRPSAINPYPELAYASHGGLDIKLREKLGPYYDTCYTMAGKCVADTMMPDTEPIPEPTQRPEILPYRSSGASHEVNPPVSFLETWRRVSDRVTAERVTKDAGHEFIDVFRDLAIEHEAHRLGERKIHPHAKPFIRGSFVAMEQALQDHKPAVAFALSRFVFQGLTYKYDEYDIVTHPAMFDIGQVAELVFPDVPALRDGTPFSRSEAGRFITKAITTLASASVGLRALDMWLGDNKEALSEAGQGNIEGIMFGRDLAACAAIMALPGRLEWVPGINSADVRSRGEVRDRVLSAFGLTPSLYATISG
ncbi:MAG TPA: hypothetical protein VMB52_07165 [Verrucomicrobiae bacterium]|nr:hypothetical protein [Verrucomicrobiae bacterium]